MPVEVVEDSGDVVERRVEVSIQAAEFCTYCSSLRICFDQPFRMDLQQGGMKLMRGPEFRQLRVIGKDGDE